MRLVGLLSYMVEHLQNARGALVSVLFLKGARPAEELTEQKIVQAPSAQGGGAPIHHTIPYYFKR